MDMHSAPAGSSAIVLSKADPRPMYVQILEQIKQRVAVGDLAPGEELPSIRQLAIDLQVSVITVKRAYLELEREGVIHTQHGKGSTVAEAPSLGPGLLEQDLEGHLEAAARLGTQLGLDPDHLADRLRQLCRRSGSAAATEPQEE